jgi:hypothetical protein
MISTILQYSTNEFNFLEANLQQCSKFSDEIIIPICNQFFSGESEDLSLIKKTKEIVKKYNKAYIIFYNWEGDKKHNCYYHNLSRKIGTDNAKNEWLLFLDADEIPSDEFNDWFQTVSHLDQAWWFSCYWYFREPIYQAVCNEGAGLLIPKKYCNWDLENKLERAQLFQKLYDTNKLSVSGIHETLSLSGNKLIHHYSWVRNKNQMLKKVKNWAHNKDKNWNSLIEQEFSHAFGGTDFVHNYNYITVDNYFNIKTNDLSVLDELLVKYIFDPENPEHNYNLAIFYESLDQTASALSYFLRCAERSFNLDQQYECLIKGAMCFEKQGKRNFTVQGLLQHALSICPKRPEGYYLLSRFYEKEDRNGHWQDSYMIASIGEKVVDDKISCLNNVVYYPGFYGIKFQKSVAAWWCGLIQEARDITLDLLHKEPYIDPSFINPCLNNLKIMKTKPFINYDCNKHKLKKIFNNYEIIQTNYSEAFQDIFVLTVLNGKSNGCYLEIGAGDPLYGNNTYLLENVFNWKGISIDIDENTVNNYNQIRSNKCFCKDAICTNYSQFLNALDCPKTIDYLQLDCDPPEITYKALLSLPLDSYKFAIITYEHDYYCDDTKSFQDKSSKYLESYGYIKVINNIAPDNHRNYEDWWIHPDLADRSQYEDLIDLSDRTKNSQYIFLQE